MTWSRRWLIDSQDRWFQVLSALRTFELDFKRKPVELIAREPHEEKKPVQRRTFHMVCTEIGRQVGLTPGAVKWAVKKSYYGIEIRTVKGIQYEELQSSEDSDKMDYAALIDHALQWGSEAGAYVVIDPKKRKIFD